MAGIHRNDNQYIPLKSRLTKRRKAIWITNKALKAVRCRRQVYNPAYVKEAATLLHHARRNFEEKLALKIKDDKRSFFAYVRSKSKGTVTTPGAGRRLSCSA